MGVKGQSRGGLGTLRHLVLGRSCLIPKADEGCSQDGLQFLERLGLASRAGPRPGDCRSTIAPRCARCSSWEMFRRAWRGAASRSPTPQRCASWCGSSPGLWSAGAWRAPRPTKLGEAPFLVLEATDGRVLLIPQTPAMEERRGEGGLRRGHVVTLREHESVRAGRSVRWTEIQEHGRLRDLVRHASSRLCSTWR